MCGHFGDPLATEYVHTVNINGFATDADEACDGAVDFKIKFLFEVNEEKIIGLYVGGDATTHSNQGA